MIARLFFIERWAGTSRTRWAIVFAALFLLFVLGGSIAPLCA